MEAYCVKCKEKREMQNPLPTFTSTGTPMTRGICPVCGTNRNEKDCGCDTVVLDPRMQQFQDVFKDFKEV